jgi:hypothetical protein
MLVDADDVISPDCCEYVMRDVEEALYDCVIYRFLWNKDVFPTEQPEQRKELSKDEVRTTIFNIMGCTTDDFLSHISWGGPCAKIFRRSAIESIGLRFNTRVLRCEDALFCMEYFQNFGSIVLDNHYIYGYMNNSESVCRIPSDKIVRTLPTCIEAIASFAEKYRLTDVGYKRQIGYRIRQYLFDAEWKYFLRKKGTVAVAREYFRFLRTPILRKYLKILLANPSLSPKERLALFVRTSFVSFPYMILNKLRINVDAC